MRANVVLFCLVVASAFGCSPFAANPHRPLLHPPHCCRRIDGPTTTKGR